MEQRIYLAADEILAHQPVEQRKHRRERAAQVVRDRREIGARAAPVDETMVSR